MNIYCSLIVYSIFYNFASVNFISRDILPISADIRTIRESHKNQFGDVGMLPSNIPTNGVDGSRTRVQKPIPCTSTIIVRYLDRTCSGLFPPAPGNEHPDAFSSFMIRPCAQSLTHVVSHIVDARILRCECPRADSSH